MDKLRRQNHIRLPMGYKSHSKRCSNRLELYLISLLGQLFIGIGVNNDQIGANNNIT